MDTIAYHQMLAVLAHERGDCWRAARHYQDAANCYQWPEQGEPCRQLAEQELAHAKAGAALVALAGTGITSGSCP
jgi:hypothetical protein